MLGSFAYGNFYLGGFFTGGYIFVPIYPSNHKGILDLPFYNCAISNLDLYGSVNNNNISAERGDIDYVRGSLRNEVNGGMIEGQYYIGSLNFTIERGSISSPDFVSGSMDNNRMGGDLSGIDIRGITNDQNFDNDVVFN